MTPAGVRAYDPFVSRLPSLGPRGEGWLALQVLLILATVVAGVSGPAWAGALRLVTTVAGAAALIAGVGLILRAQHDLRDALSPFPRPRTRGALVQDGVYRLIRHPIYAGLALAAVGWALAGAAPVAFLAAGALIVVLDLKSRREEAWLRERYPDYEAYRSRANRFIPRIY
jgi:protein-S-isoprenylcysteine O-methyltransferase Ste14